MNNLIDKKIADMSTISKADYMDWRQSLAESFPDMDDQEAMYKFWAEAAQHLVKNHLENTDNKTPILVQLKMLFDKLGMGMGESVVSISDNGKLRVSHNFCQWHKCHEESNPDINCRKGCDVIFDTVISNISDKTGSWIEVQTVNSKTDGDQCCKRVIQVVDPNANV